MRRSRPHDRQKVVATLRYLEVSPHDLPEPVVARVNQGRWIADCPTCRGAELVLESLPFLCGSCGAVGPVTWPSNVREIEEALEGRPIVNQNWSPGETVAMLAAEGMEH